MKIVCTLKEFESISARCPWNNLFINEDKFNELIDKCEDNCLLYHFCYYGKDENDDWSLADLVEIIPESTK